jgi:hypothetical protein
MISSGLTVMDMRSAQHFLQGGECCTSLPQWLLHRGHTVGAVSRMQRALSEINIERAEIQTDIAIKSLITAMEFEIVGLPNSNIAGKLTLSLSLYLRFCFFLFFSFSVDKTRLSYTSHNTNRSYRRATYSHSATSHSSDVLIYDREEIG